MLLVLYIFCRPRRLCIVRFGLTLDAPYNYSLTLGYRGILRFLKFTDSVLGEPAKHRGEV